eukprot:12174182-Prorocentrum_lima.AAC.1
MTSSLVGSEMCIRDRVRREEQEKKELDWMANLHGLLSGGGVQKTTFGNTCLLYTSDAADDM